MPAMVVGLSGWRLFATLAGASTLGWNAGRWSSSDPEETRAARHPGMPLSMTSLEAADLIPAPRPSSIDTSLPNKSEDHVTRITKIMRFGFPSGTRVRQLSNFVLSYDRRNRVPLWVFEHLTPESIRKTDGVDRDHSRFHTDEVLHPYFRSTSRDYYRSGYDRGHMAAAANHRSSQLFMDETFLLSNMAPQVGEGFNRDKWNELEQRVRKMVRKQGSVYVCTGPLYLPRQGADGKLRVTYEVIGDNHVSVPTHFFKLVVSEDRVGKLHLESFVLPNAPINDSVPLEQFYTPLESVERSAGLIFFDRMEKGKLATINKVPV